MYFLRIETNTHPAMNERLFSINMRATTDKVAVEAKIALRIHTITLLSTTYRENSFYRHQRKELLPLIIHFFGIAVLLLRKTNMGSIRVLSVALVVFVLILMMTSEAVEATYRKPPFNGSIFGKRAGSNNNGTYRLVVKFKNFCLYPSEFFFVFSFYSRI